MDPVVPQGVIADLSQILDNLLLNDNAIRSEAEKAITDRLAQNPEVYLLALTQFAVSADAEVMRSFAFVLLRRFLFRPLSQPQSTEIPNAQPNSPTIYDHLSSDALSAIEHLLLHSLSHEAIPTVRQPSLEMISALANHSTKRGRPWHALYVQVFSMTQSPNVALRGSAFRVFACIRMPEMGAQIDVILRVLKGGLEDEIIDVRFFALQASGNYLLAADANQLAQSLPLVPIMLGTLPSVPLSHFPKFVSSLTLLALIKSTLFEPHLHPLLDFLAPLILCSNDSSSTPTRANPDPNNGSSEASKLSSGADNEQMDEEKQDIKKAALEFMLTLSHGRSGIVRNVDGWIPTIVRGCLDGMATLRNDDLDEWLASDPTEDPMDDSYADVCEQSLARLTSSLGSETLMAPAFQYIPSMLANYDWRMRHAALLAIAKVMTGGTPLWSHRDKLMNEMPDRNIHEDLGKIVEMVIPLFNDGHPRVRYAACQCIEQLCANVQYSIQTQYCKPLFVVLITMLEAPESRLHSQAAKSLARLCGGIHQAALTPYLGPIVERLLKLIGAPGSNINHPEPYVVQHVIHTLAVLAQASRRTFATHYSSIMPLLLNILQHAKGPDYRNVRLQTMECTGVIAIAVGRDIFRPDASKLAELLVGIQNGPPDSGDTMLNMYLMATWPKICQTIGVEFEPYLPVVMPLLIRTATTDAENKVPRARSFLSPGDDEQSQALRSLVVYCSTLQARFAPYVMQSLELTLSTLRLHSHDGIQESCISLVPMLLSCSAASSTLTAQIVTVTFHELVNCIGFETESLFLKKLLKCFIKSLKIVGGPTALSEDLHNGATEAIKYQLDIIADKRKNRSQQSVPEQVDDLIFKTVDFGALDDDMETFAIEDMERFLRYLNPNHPLLVAVASVRALGRRRGINLGAIDDLVSRLKDIYPVPAGNL